MSVSGLSRDSHGVTELVAVLVSTPVLLVPRLQDLVQARRARLVVNLFGILFRDVIVLGRQVGNVTANEQLGVKVSQVDLFGQV